jgi:catalase
MTRHSILAWTLAAALLTAFAPEPVRAQNGERLRAWHERQVAQRQESQRQGAQQQEAQREQRGGRAQMNPRGAAGLPPKWVENLREMPPGEQERFLQNNEKFQSLAPARQAQIRQNLEKWNRLTPDQKDRIRATEQMFEQMSPEQRERFRDEIVPKLAQLAPERRQRVIGHWRRLQAMTPDEQQAALRDPRFMPGLSPDEQSLVRNLNSMGAPPPEAPSGGPAQ